MMNWIKLYTMNYCLTVKWRQNESVQARSYLDYYAQLYFTYLSQKILEIGDYIWNIDLLNKLKSTTINAY